jgi:hypothetical protein
LESVIGGPGDDHDTALPDGTADKSTAVIITRVRKVEATLFFML